MGQGSEESPVQSVKMVSGLRQAVRPRQLLGPRDCKKSDKLSQCLNRIQIIKRVESRETRLQARLEPLATGWSYLFLAVKFAVQRKPILQTGKLRPRG